MTTDQVSFEFHDIYSDDELNTIRALNMDSQPLIGLTQSQFLKLNHLFAQLNLVFCYNGDITNFFLLIAIICQV